MKKTYRKKWGAVLLTAAVLCMPSCVDDGYDMDNVSMAMQWEGALGVPVLNESKITVKQIVDQFNFDDSQVKLVDDNGMLALEFDTAVAFAIPDINEDFKNFDNLFNQDLRLFEGMTVPNLTLQDEVSFPFAFSAADFWEQVNGGQYADKHRINRIQFYNVGLALTVSGTDITIQPGGSITVSLQLPGEGNQTVDFAINEFGTETVYKDLVLDLNALRNEDINATITAAGGVTIGGTPELTVSLGLDFSQIGEFIAYGYFNYVLTAGTEKLDAYQTGLYDINGIDWKLSLPAARFDFDVTSSFGVPLELQLNKITVKHHSKTDSVSEPVNKQYDIARADVLNTTKNSILKFEDRNILERLITTDLEGVAVSYVVKTQEVDVANPGNTPEQFISSKGKLNIRNHTVVPAEFGEHDFITYVFPDTLEMDNEKIDLGDDVQLSDLEALLRVSVFNGLGLPITAKAILCSKNSSGEYDRAYGVDSITIDLESKQDWKENLKITLDKEAASAKHAVNEWYASGKAIIMEYRVPPLDPEQARHGIWMGDAIRAKIGIGAKGKVTVNN